MIQEAHKKKHNSPKNDLAAINKGNREAEREIYGNGFKSKNRIHKSLKTQKKPKYKEDYLRNLDEQIDRIVSESIKKILREDYGQK